MNLDLMLTVLVLLVLLSSGMVGLLLQVKESRQRRYDEEKHRAELDELRKSLEERTYLLMDRLTSTDQRWKEVNHLLLSGQRASPRKGVDYPVESVPHLEFLVQAGIDPGSVTVDRKLVFVLTPFHPDFEAVFLAIRESCLKIGLSCMRGDEEHIQVGNILRHILRLVVRARLIVAVVDGRNPNVFYELGIAHAIGKPVLLIGKSKEDVPFDINANRVLFYSDISQLKERLDLELAKVLAA